MHSRLSYANVTATLALFFAISGGALAARHYLINSTNQISPKVLRALRGKAGPHGVKGATGAPGALGAPGPQGKEGASGKEGSPGKEGKEGPRGTALAYTHLTAEGAVDASLSSNFAGAVISHTPGSGIYCISGLPFTPHNVVASIDSTIEPGVVETSVKPTTFVACPSSNQIELVTFNPNTGAKEYKLGDYATFMLLN